MKRHTPLVLGAAFLLLASALSAAPQAPGKGSQASSAARRESAAVVRPKLQTDSDPVRREIESLRVRQARDSGEIAKIIRNQLRAVTRFRNLESDTGTWLGLLALATAFLIAAGNLGLGWHQRKSFAVLEERMLGRLEKLQQALLSGVAAGREAPASQSSDAGQKKIKTDDFTPPVGRAAAADPEGSPSPTGQGDPGHSGTSADAALSIPPGMRHAEIARLLARLRREVPQLSGRFADPELRERFHGELDAPVGARLERLILVSKQGEEQLQKRWLGPDLVTTLDALARFYSEAVEEERQGHANGLARDLRSWLEAFGTACRLEGWFTIDAIDPYMTKFDPRVHHAVAGRDIEGAEGRIIAVKAIGRRDPGNGAVLSKAEVIVGR
jgi:hypothetical protein